jgi:prepilin-type N-terminal cleavage/methylation domain-containing protein
MNKNQGFTLMELLIVIGVLGILAAGLLAAIDPFEQLKKARDANNRNATIETVTSFTRYYATHGNFPWNLGVPPVGCKTATDATDLLPLKNGTGAVVPLTVGAGTELETCITSALITNDGELKTSFFDGLQTDLYLSSTGPTSLQVCFNPESKALRNDLVSTTWYYDSGSATMTKETRNGVDGGECDTDLDNCMQCFQ